MGLDGFDGVLGGGNVFGKKRLEVRERMGGEVEEGSLAWKQASFIQPITILFLQAGHESQRLVWSVAADGVALEVVSFYGGCDAQQLKQQLQLGASREGRSMLWLTLMDIRGERMVCFVHHPWTCLETRISKQARRQWEHF